MQYFKIETGKFIQYDENTNRARVIVITELLALRKDLLARIAEADPNQPETDEEWIKWAKDNYTYVDHSVEQEELDKINEILLAIKNL